MPASVKYAHCDCGEPVPGGTIKAIRLLCFPFGVPELHGCLDHSLGRRGYRLESATSEGDAYDLLVVVSQTYSHKERDAAKWQDAHKIIRHARKTGRPVLFFGNRDAFYPDDLVNTPGFERVEFRGTADLVRQVEEKLMDNLASFLETSGYVTYDDYRNPQAGRLRPILPDQFCPLYVRGSYTKLNQELMEPIERLFVASGRLNPLAAEDYVRLSSQCIDSYVRVLVQNLRSVSERGNAEARHMYFTDYAIAKRDRRSWLVDECFIQILRETFLASYDPSHRSLKTPFPWMKRFFFFDVPTSESEQKDHRQFRSFVLPSAARVMFLLLAMGVEIWAFREVSVRDVLTERDMNLFLVPQDVVGILDARFPYVRIYQRGVGSDPDKALRDGYLDTTLQRLRELESRYPNQRIGGGASVEHALDLFRATDGRADADELTEICHADDGPPGVDRPSQLEWFGWLLASGVSETIEAFAQRLPYSSALTDLKDELKMKLRY
jgi:hypothetical protein